MWPSSRVVDLTTLANMNHPTRKFKVRERSTVPQRSGRLPCGWIESPNTPTSYYNACWVSRSNRLPPPETKEIRIMRERSALRGWLTGSRSSENNWRVSSVSVCSKIRTVSSTFLDVVCSVITDPEINISETGKVCHGLPWFVINILKWLKM